MSESIAIATLALGERYLRPWQEVCEPGCRAYANAHGYDVVCLTTPPDGSARARSRSPAWQKCLILSQPELEGYDRVVWVDADVVINPDAPSVVAGVPRELVGAVDEYSIPDRETHRANLEKLTRFFDQHKIRYVPNSTPADYYRVYGLPDHHDAVVQTGVMVLSPAHHTDLLARVYRDYEQRGGPEWNYEMRPLSFELMEAGVVRWIDPRFNYIWGLYRSLHYPFLLNHPNHESAPDAVAEALADTYFMHFAGGTDELSLPGAALRRRRALLDHTETTPGVAPVRESDPARARTPAKTTARRPGLETPVVLAIYARADTTGRVLGAIRKARPPHLLVIADAPPEGDPEKAAAVAAARALVESVDWDCEVETEFAEHHMGTRRRIESGLDWAFERVEEAIILEDDCLPNASFFEYCEALLRRYRDSPQVMAISGNDFQFQHRPTGPSYSFTRYPLIWGWATWRRAWLAHDQAMADWPELRERRWLAEQLHDPHAVSYWTHLFDLTHRGEIDTWDYGFVLSVWRERALSIQPHRNLVSNLGFRADATHTRFHDSAFSNAPTHELDFPLTHPDQLERDHEAEAFIEDVMFSGNLARLFDTIRDRRAALAQGEPA